MAGIHGSKLTTSAALQAILERSAEVFPHEEFQPKYTEGPQSLSAFSTWLSDFDPSMHRLEIPGQYAADIRRGDGPPRLEEHTYIVGVDPSVLVMSSIRKPKRIKFLASKWVRTWWWWCGGGGGGCGRGWLLIGFGTYDDYYLLIVITTACLPTYLTNPSLFFPIISLPR